MNSSPPPYVPAAHTWHWREQPVVPSVWNQKLFPRSVLCSVFQLSVSRHESCSPLQNITDIINFLKVRCYFVARCLPRHDNVCRQVFVNAKAKQSFFSISEVLAYFISWVHPHYGGSLRIPSLWCVGCMLFMSHRRAEEGSDSKKKKEKERKGSNHLFSLLVQTTGLLSCLSVSQKCILNSASSGHVL